MATELRSGPRLSTSLPVALQFPEAEPSEGWGRILDISLAGAKIETRCAFKAGQAVYLTFEARKEMHLENLRSRVVRVSWEEGYYEAGLTFEDSVDRAYLREALIVLMSR